MKLKLFSITLLLLFGSASFSQVIVGIKAGATINKITGRSFNDQFTYGYHGGLFATIHLGSKESKFSIQPEVLFNQVNADTSSNFSSVYQFNHIDKIRLKYLSLPILLNYNVSNLLALQLGPQFGILIDQNKDLLTNGGDAFKKGDISGVGGVQVKLLRYRFYGRYLLGLNDVSNISGKDMWKTQSFQLGIGYAL